MPTFTHHPAGTPCWIDLMTDDVDAATAALGAIFGWEATPSFDDDGNRIYTNMSLDDKVVAGVGSMPPGAPEGMPIVWNTYVAVDDVQAAEAAIVAAGGSVLAPAMQVMEHGWMGAYTDPTGAAFSVWQAGSHFGVELANEPNTYSWNELLTRDLETAKAFYTTVFGWEYESGGPEMADYNVIVGGANGGLGGLMAMPADMPPMVPNHWMVYFTVTDLEASSALVVDNGGSRAQGPVEIPIGSFSIFHHPHLGSFTLLQPAEG